MIEGVLTPEQEAALDAYYREVWRREKFGAAIMLLTTWRRGDHRDLGFFQHLAFKAAALIAIALGREGFDESDADGSWHINPGHWLNNVDMGWWDCSRRSDGWSCKYLRFHPLQFRYEIDGDGESYM